MAGWEMIHIDEKNLKCEHLNDVYERLANIIGLDLTLRVYQEFRGQHVNFPVRLFSRNYVLSEVVRCYDGKNVNTLATRFNYSERQIRQMLKDAIDDS